MAGEHTLAEPKLKVNDAHLYPLTNVSTKCQPSTPYRIQEIARTNFKTHGPYNKVKGQINITQ